MVPLALPLPGALSHPRCNRKVLKNYGNMSSGTLIFVLQELDRIQQAGDTCLLSSRESHELRERVSRCGRWSQARQMDTGTRVRAWPQHRRSHAACLWSLALAMIYIHT